MISNSFPPPTKFLKHKADNEREQSSYWHLIRFDFFGISIAIIAQPMKAKPRLNLLSFLNDLQPSMPLSRRFKNEQISYYHNQANGGMQ